MKIACLVLAAIGLAGCAPLTPLTAASDGAVETDNARMALIERAARMNGVTVVWINAPRKASGQGS